MIIEIRERNLQQSDELLNLKPDIFGIGDEACVHKLPVFNRVLGLKQKANQAGVQFRYITPKLSQFQIDPVIETIQILSEDDRDYYLTVNDLGLLYACKVKGILPSHVTVGRGLSKSLEDCQWYEHILRDEEPTYKQTLLQNSMSHKLKIDLMKREFQVDSIEGNMLDHQQISFRNFQKNGWRVSVHYGLIITSISRTCQTAKYYATNPPDCAPCCWKGIEIEMAQIWDKRELYDLSEELKQLNPHFTLWGNIVYRENTTKLTNYDFHNIDGFIFNASQFESVAQVETEIRKVKEAAKNEKIKAKSAS